MCNYAVVTELDGCMENNQRILKTCILLSLAFVTSLAAKRQVKGTQVHPMPIGSEGVKWYTTWETAKALVY